MSRLKAILALRCSHCLQGEVFAGLLKMHERCPVCGIQYEREHGFFLVSIFIGYILGLTAVLPLLIVLYSLDAPIWWYVIGVSIVLILLSPWIMRYSRVLWLHIDELLDPRADN